MVNISVKEKKMEITAPVFNIQKFCTHDGSGIRTTVFFKGCNMKCEWCANPESQKKEPELLFYQNKCTNCGKCITVCTENAISSKNGKIIQNRELCINCGECADECLFDARALLGKVKSVDEVFADITEDKIFYETSGGGVTFSGGEPLLYIDFISELIEKCRKEGINTAAETCGCFPERNLKHAGKLDVMLFDIKFINNEKHKKYCGCTNEKIIKNFRAACEIAEVQPRIPIIPGINDTTEDIEAVTRFLQECNLNSRLITILPYHNLGVCKYEAMGKPYELNNLGIPDKDYMNEIKKTFESYGFEIKIGG